MPLVKRTLVEHFEGGAVGDGVTTTNSIFTLTSADEPAPYGPRFFAGGRTGNLASNVPYPPSQGGTGLLRFEPPSADTSNWSLATFYGYFHAQDPITFPTYAAFIAAVLTIADTEAAGLALLRDTIDVTSNLVGYEMWFCISADRSLSADSGLVNTNIYLTAVASLLRQDDGVSFGLHLAGASSDPLVTIGSWYRIAYVRPGRVGAGLKAYSAGGTLLSSSAGTDTTAFDVQTRGVEIGLTNPLTYRPIEVDDITISYEIWSSASLPVLVTPHPTRRYPRDDGNGIAGSRRNYPPSKAARNYGGQQ